jgi:two-component system, cell cycle response regulator
VIRLLAGLGVLAPVVFGLVLLAAPGVFASWSDDGVRSIAAAIVAGVLGVSLTATLVAGYLRFRVGRIVRAVERIAAGDREAVVPVSRRGVEGRLSRAVGTLADQLSATRESASIDRLTGVANRQSLLGALWSEVERANRYNRPFSVAFVDIDHFKQVNDTYGHASGDLVLRGMAQAIKANLRQNDLIGRYGGEEFMILLPETGVEEAAALCEKLRHIVGRLRFTVEGNPALTMTISIGVAGGLGQSLRRDALVRDADAAMYSAKALGRNQTYVFAEPDEDARVPRAPISPAGRARAEEIGQVAREAAEAALAAIVAPLPHYRGQPSALIGSIVVAMASQLDLPDQEVDRIRIAAILHDIGKVAIPAEILEKPTPLTSAEWRTVVQHPRIAQVILEQATVLREAVPIILHHHERYSGHGYPFGLRGADIPLGARIVAIADAYDAMTHDRPYKAAITHAEAVAELRRNAGTQFDPDLVGLFCDLYEDAAPQADGEMPPVAAVARRSGSGSGSVRRPHLVTAREDESVVTNAAPLAGGGGAATRSRGRNARQQDG